MTEPQKAIAHSPYPLPPRERGTTALPDDPAQLFFDFVEPSDPVRTGPPLGASPYARPEKARASVGPASVPAGAASAFVTEARAAELFLNAARDCRTGTIQSAQVIFKPFRATLYSFKIHTGGAARVKFHVVFRKAPENVLFQAAQIMLRRRRGARGDYRFARGEYDAFVRAIAPGEFELPGARRGRRISFSGPGRCRSLEESFERVNREYFHSQLERPELCWSPVRARRVLGSYQERSDRLIISQVFDSPDVPLFVLDYLMYHELLHKFLGIGRRGDGKRCMHGREFRSIEKQFKYFRQAQQYLKRM